MDQKEVFNKFYQIGFEKVAINSNLFTAGEAIGASTLAGAAGGIFAEAIRKKSLIERLLRRKKDYLGQAGVGALTGASLSTAGVLGDKAYHSSGLREFLKNKLVNN
jgi:hypothetical protein